MLVKEKAPTDRHIGVIGVGYSDGFRRGPRSSGTVVCGGVKVPVIGSVMMNHTIVDLTEAPATAVGDEVVLVGRQGDQEITFEEIATQVGTINEEVVTAISPAVPRYYKST